MLDTGFKPQVLSIFSTQSLCKLYFVLFWFSFLIAATQYLSSGLLNRFLNYISAHNIYPFTCACVISPFSHVQLCATLWTVVCQAPLLMGFSRQEYQSGLPCPPPGDLPNLRMKPMSLMSLFFITSAT